VRTYVVQPGDSPARIAIAHAGCPKCAIDLVEVNPHKSTVRHPNGFLSFTALRVGETLALPDKWFSPEFDRLPATYFAALPHPDGTTRGGALGDYQTFDRAVMAVNSASSQGDAQFHSMVDAAADLIGESIIDTIGSTNVVVASLRAGVQEEVARARGRNVDLGVALSSGNATTAALARLDVQRALATALGTARVALDAFYSQAVEPPLPRPPVLPPIVPAPPSPPPPPPSSSEPVAATPKRGVSAGAMLSMGLFGAGVVCGAIYLGMEYLPKRRRRVRRVA